MSALLGVLLRIIVVFLVGCGLLVMACNYQSAEDGDRKSIKHKNLGLGLFWVGEVIGCASCCFECLMR